MVGGQEGGAGGGRRRGGSHPFLNLLMVLHISGRRFSPFERGREATTGNTSALCMLICAGKSG